jgi:cobalt-zinc-cadmium efflux system outer membrane protein
VDAALSRGARLGVARADTLTAFAQLLIARARDNPVFAASYSKAVPQYHTSLDLPLSYPGLRRTLTGAAEAGRQAAQYRFAFERASIMLAADTTYTRALAALARARLSARTAQDADSLRRMAIARRDAGDASELDVELATVNAGQQANVAATDSLSAIFTILELQLVIGLASDRVAIVPADSLTLPPALDQTLDGSVTTALAGSPLPVAAAQAALNSAELASRAQRRSVFGVPSVSVGFETHDPSGGETGILPTVGLSLPLPLLNRNRGNIALAEAERARARAELTLAQLESRTTIARVLRERAGALARVERDRRLLSSADRVAAMSLTAYREGASSLPNVLEAQRNAREILVQYLDDLAAAWIATATLRVVTAVPTSTPAPIPPR